MSSSTSPIVATTPLSSPPLETLAINSAATAIPHSIAPSRSHLLLTPSSVHRTSPPMEPSLHNNSPNQITMSVQNHDRQDWHVNQEQRALEEFGTAASGFSSVKVNTPNGAAIEQQQPQEQPQVERSVSTPADDTRPPSIADTGQICRSVSSNSKLDFKFI